MMEYLTLNDKQFLFCLEQTAKEGVSEMTKAAMQSDAGKKAGEMATQAKEKTKEGVQKVAAVVEDKSKKVQGKA